MHQINLFSTYENRILAKNQQQKEIPVTIVTGFLGSGKTTLLRHILGNKWNLKIACAVNDFAAINIDEKILADERPDSAVYQLKNGCICCPFVLDPKCTELKEIVWQILHEETLQKQGIDYLIIETSGTTDPLSIIQAVQQKFGKMTRARLDSVVTVLDADAWEQNRTNPIALNQIKVADVILLNKVDLVSAERINQLRHSIQELAPNAHLHNCTFGSIYLPKILDLETTLDQGTDNKKGAVSHETAAAQWIPSTSGGRLNLTSSTVSKTASEDQSTYFTSISLESSIPISLSGLSRWLAECTANLGVLRVKGIVRLTDNESERYVLQVSGRQRVSIESTGTWKHEPKTQVCVIGHDFDEAPITSLWEHMVNASCSQSMEPVDVKLLEARLDERFQVISLSPSAISFRLCYPKSRLDETAIRHHHHVDLDETQKLLVDQMNRSGLGLKLVFVESSKAESDSKTLASCILAPYSSIFEDASFELLDKLTEQFFEEMKEKLVHCMCGF